MRAHLSPRKPRTTRTTVAGDAGGGNEVHFILPPSTHGTRRPHGSRTGDDAVPLVARAMSPTAGSPRPPEPASTPTYYLVDIEQQMSFPFHRLARNPRDRLAR